MMLYDAMRFVVAGWLDFQQIIKILEVTAGNDDGTNYLNWSDMTLFIVSSLFALVAPVFIWMFYYASFKAEFNATEHDLITIILDSVKLVIQLFNFLTVTPFVLMLLEYRPDGLGF